MDNVIKKELAERDEAARPHLEKLKPHRAFAKTNPTGIPGKQEKSRSLTKSATDGFRLVDSKLRTCNKMSFWLLKGRDCHANLRFARNDRLFVRGSKSN